MRTDSEPERHNHPMSLSNLETVFDHLHDRASGDLGAVAAQLDPAVVHQGVVADMVCSGRDAVVARMRAAQGGDRLSGGIDRIELVDAGDRVIVGLHGDRFRQVPWLTGGQLFIVYTLRDGQIARMDDHRSRAEAFTAAGIEPADWV